MAPAPATAVISELSDASSVTSPTVVDTSLPPLISAASVLLITLTDAAPAPESAMPPPAPPEPLPAKPIVATMMSAVDSASSAIGPAAAIVELSITASIELSIRFTASDEPTAPATPPPAPPEPPPDAPPAKPTMIELSSADSSTAPPVVRSEPFTTDASIVLSITFTDIEPPLDICKPPPAPPEPPAAKPIVAVTIVADSSASTVTSPGVLTVEPSIDAVMLLVIVLFAKDAPAWPETPPPAPPEPDAATAPATEVISELSAASSVTLPLVVDTLLPPLISAARVLLITLTEPAPAPESAMPPPAPPEPLPAKPMVATMMSAVDSASSAIRPAAATIELSISATIVFEITFTASDEPTAPATPPPAPPEPPPDAPPAKPTMTEVSSADSNTAPPDVTSEPFTIDASTELSITLTDMDPAAESCTPPPAPPEPPPAKPIVAVTIVADSSASIVTAPGVLTTEPSIDAVMLLVIVLFAKDAPP